MSQAGQTVLQPQGKESVAAMRDVDGMPNPVMCETDQNTSETTIITEQEQNINRTGSDGDDALSALDDPNFHRLISAWGRLPETIKAGILAMIDATVG